MSIIFRVDGLLGKMTGAVYGGQVRKTEPLQMFKKNTSQEKWSLNLFRRRKARVTRKENLLQIFIEHANLSNRSDIRIINPLATLI